ncbi:hypothetical protein D3C78_998540 [compost metagenome]
MVVVGKADKLAVGTKYMDMAAAAQRTGRVGRGDVHCVEIFYLRVLHRHTAAMMKIVLPARIRIFRAVDKYVFVIGRMNGHHANVRAMAGTINHLALACFDIHTFNGFAGKRRAGRTHVKHQPVAVGSPGIDIGELMMAGSESDLFHEDTLMRGYRIRVKHRKALAYTFHIANQQDVRECANQRHGSDIHQRRAKAVILRQIAYHQRNRDPAETADEVKHAARQADQTHRRKG